MGVREVMGEWLDRKGTGSPGTVDRVVSLPVAEIVPNPAQPRKLFAQSELESLARSIEREGLLQPVLVRRTPNGYELIAGERRLQAVKSLGKSHIPAIVRDGSDTQSALWALIENLQRQDLSFFEEAAAIEALIQVWGINQEEAALRLGRSQPAVANKLRLLKLSPAAGRWWSGRDCASGRPGPCFSCPRSGRRRQPPIWRLKNSMSPSPTPTFNRC